MDRGTITTGSAPGIEAVKNALAGVDRGLESARGGGTFDGCLMLGAPVSVSFMESPVTSILLAGKLMHLEHDLGAGRIFIPESQPSPSTNHREIIGC
jgi:hypothetical protein